MAPGATYWFVNYHSPDEFGQAVDYITNVIRPQIVVHSNSFLFGPFDGSGWFAQKVDAAAASGDPLAQLGGNYRTRHWEGAWSDADGDGNLDVPGDGNAFRVDLIATSRPSCDISWVGATSNPADYYTLALYQDAALRRPCWTRTCTRRSCPAGSRPCRIRTPRCSRARSPPPVPTTWRCGASATRRPTRLTGVLPHGSLADRAGDGLELPHARRCGRRVLGGRDRRDHAPARVVLLGGADRRRPQQARHHGADERAHHPRAIPRRRRSPSCGGTSCSTPHVAGAAALLWPGVAAEGGAGSVAQRVRDRLRGTGARHGHAGHRHRLRGRPAASRSGGTRAGRAVAREQRARARNGRALAAGRRCGHARVAAAHGRRQAARGHARAGRHPPRQLADGRLAAGPHAFVSSPRIRAATRDVHDHAARRQSGAAGAVALAAARRASASRCACRPRCSTSAADSPAGRSSPSATGQSANGFHLAHRYKRNGRYTLRSAPPIARATRRSSAAARARAPGRRAWTPGRG